MSSMKEFFQDKGQAKQLSAVRLALFVWLGGVLGVWGIVSYRTNSLQAVPESVVTILGLLLGAKAVQRFGER